MRVRTASTLAVFGLRGTISAYLLRVHAFLSRLKSAGSSLALDGAQSIVSFRCQFSEQVCCLLAIVPRTLLFSFGFWLPLIRSLCEDMR